MPDLAAWEKELLAIPPACVCDFVDATGQRVLSCRIHDNDDDLYTNPRSTNA